MIKAKGIDKDGFPIYIFGLSELNVQRLKEGKPVGIDLRELGDRGKVLILYGETEESIRDELLKIIDVDHVIDHKNQSG